MVRISLGNALLAAMVALAGCSASHGTGEPCGPSTCNPGLVCCDESCGICVAPGAGCPAIHCLPDDGGVDAGDDAGSVPADALVRLCGGEICGPSSQCCAGCEPGQDRCRPLGEPCPEPVCPPRDAGVDGGPAPGQPCGGHAGETCDPGEFCDYGAQCHALDAPGVCRPIPEACIEPACREVCGCDGTTYCSECEAHSAGVSVLHEGACEPSDCAAMDARGRGLCDAELGYAWNGESCVSISGCNCAGVDCDALFASPGACSAAYASCSGTDDCRATGCDAGSRCILCWVDYACVPDGAVC